MYNFKRLTKKNLIIFSDLNDSIKTFNKLNQDFFEAYNNSNFIDQFYLRNQVKLLYCNKECIGFLWVKRNGYGQYTINSLNICDPIKHVEGCSFLFKTIRNICEYECEKNSFNFSILPQLGFKKGEGTIELYKSIEHEELLWPSDGTTYQVFSRGQHEEIRCKLQNEIFGDNNREPMTIEDIYFDLIQEYFWDEGSIFIKHNGVYIGYGQIILDGPIPTIVNFGITKPYRSKGFGKLLLSYLINILYKNGYKQARIKVNSNNTLAFEMYKKMGFIMEREYYKWTLSK